MCHLRLIDLAKPRCDLLALVELVKYSRHIGRGSRRRRGWRNAGGRWRGRDTSRDIERWDRRGRRRRRRGSSAASGGRPVLDLFQSIQYIETGLVVPFQALRVVLLEIGREGLEVLVVCLDVLNVCSVPATDQSLVHIGASRVVLLLLVLLEHLVTVVLDTTNHLRNKLRRLGLEEPAQCNNALRNSAQVVEHW